ncbi:hypothetical protein J437_LFUL016634 [Ladona fulva]|uniref:DDE-1 domain-containing protein n=1 Tax=Ladona fulva TaxID=123851 RepID=A0A8K0KMG1_LADFU|nr:hypothetical protein J437_LFUL016634 [Ladona fulva]
MTTRNKRLSYTIQYKQGVLNYAKVHGNRAAARHFGPPPTEKMIRTWQLQEDRLKTAKKQKHNLRCPAPSWPELENAIKMWVIDKRNSGIRSEGWYYRFMKRHDLSMRTKTTIAQKMPADYEEKIQAFHRFVINACKKTSFELVQIGNMDEIPLTFDVPSNKTVSVKGSKSITIKTTSHEKTHYMLKTHPKEKLEKGAIVHVHPKGWMDEAGMKLWLQNVLVRRPGGLLRKPSLLVWDQFRAHRTETIKNKVRELKTQIALISGGLTCQLQPLDILVNKLFKQKARERWNKWIGDPHHDLTPSGRMKQPSISEVCEWVKKSWEDIKAEVIVKSFKKCGISNALDGTEDNILFEEGDTSGDGNSSDDDFLIFDDDDNEKVWFYSRVHSDPETYNLHSDAQKETAQREHASVNALNN